MDNNAATNSTGSCPVDSWRVLHLFRTFRIGRQPAKLLLAAIALILTWLWGSFLDTCWNASDAGLEPAVAFGLLNDPYDVMDLAALDRAVIDGAAGDSAEPEPIFETAKQVMLDQWMYPARCVECIRVIWQQHFWFAVLFELGAIVIWAFFGGTICRIAAVQFARGEETSMRDALGFVRERYFSGFLLAPLMPMLIVLLIGIGLAFGGLILKIPVLGDVIGGPMYVLALVGGGIIALVLIGAVVGGALFWPTIAAEGSESLDAVSRSFNYVGAAPWHALFYGIVALLYGAVCFFFVNVVAGLTLAVTRAFVGFGTAPFGWGLRDGGMTKLDVLLRGPAANSGVEWFSSWFIGLWVMLVGLLVWSYLASFKLSAFTVIYFLLRNKVDGIDVGDVFIETYEEAEYGPADASSTAAATDAPAPPTEVAPTKPAPPTDNSPSDGESDSSNPTRPG